MSAGKRANRIPLLAMLATLTAAAVLLAPVAALAQPPGDGPGRGAGFGRGPGHGPGHGFHGRHGFGPHGEHHRGDPIRHLLARLDLTREQREEVGEIARAEREAAAPLRDEVWQARGELFEASATEAFDEGAVRAAAERVATAEIELAVARARTWSAIWGVLTPEQQAKAKAIQAGRRAFRDEMRDRRWGGPDEG